MLNQTLNEHETATRCDLDLLTAFDPARAVSPHKIGFLLLKGHSAFEVHSLKHVLQECNRLTGAHVFECVDLIHEPISDINLATIDPCTDFHSGDSVNQLHSILVFSEAGFEPNKKLRGWLRREWRHGARVCGISGGSFTLAYAGLLDRRRCTTHWSECNRLNEQLCSSTVTYQILEIDERVITCGGGVGSIDLGLMIVETETNRRTAGQIAERLLHKRNLKTSEQRCSLRIRLQTTSKPLIRAVNMMSENLETLVSRKDLATISGVSIRQLERLFNTKMGTTIGSYYKKIRLEKAQMFLSTTSMSIAEISLACGFVSVSHFSLSYKQHFGCRPSDDR